MATSEQIRSTIDRYIATFSAGDANVWAENFAEDATHEDPVGTPVNKGRSAIVEFYNNSAAMMGGSLGLEATDEPIIIGNEAVIALSATAGSGIGRVRMPQIIDHMTFDDDGKIVALRAFWTMDSVISDPEIELTS